MLAVAELLAPPVPLVAGMAAVMAKAHTAQAAVVQQTFVRAELPWPTASSSLVVAVVAVSTAVVARVVIPLVMPACCVHRLGPTV